MIKRKPHTTKLNMHKIPFLFMTGVTLYTEPRAAYYTGNATCFKITTTSLPSSFTVSTSASLTKDVYFSFNESPTSLGNNPRFFLVFLNAIDSSNTLYLDSYTARYCFN